MTNSKTQFSSRVGKIHEDETDVYIGRGEGGDVHILNSEVGEYGWLGNPYPLSDYDREESIARFTRDFLDRIESDKEFRHAVAELKGENLGCFCQNLEDEGPACHGEVIAHVADLLYK